MAACLDACNLDYAQLHGDEPPEELAALGPWAFKAIRPANTAEAKRQALRYLPPAPDGYDTLVADPQRPASLLDAAARGQFGGSGQVADWSMATRPGETLAAPACRRLAPRQRRRGGSGPCCLGAWTSPRASNPAPGARIQSTCGLLSRRRGVDTVTRRHGDTATRRHGDTANRRSDG